MTDLARAIGVRPEDTRSLSLAVGIGRRWIRRYRLVGLSELQADRWAARCGLHVLEVWPDWPDGPVSPLAGEALAEEAAS